MKIYNKRNKETLELVSVATEFLDGGLYLPRNVNGVNSYSVNEDYRLESSSLLPTVKNAFWLLLLLRLLQLGNKDNACWSVEGTAVAIKLSDLAKLGGAQKGSVYGRIKESLERYKKIFAVVKNQRIGLVESVTLDGRSLLHVQFCEEFVRRCEPNKEGERRSVFWMPLDYYREHTGTSLRMYEVLAPKVRYRKTEFVIGARKLADKIGVKYTRPARLLSQLSKIEDLVSCRVIGENTVIKMIAHDKAKNEDVSLTLVTRDTNLQVKGDEVKEKNKNVLFSYKNNLSDVNENVAAKTECAGKRSDFDEREAATAFVEIVSQIKAIFPNFDPKYLTNHYNNVVKYGKYFVDQVKQGNRVAEFKSRPKGITAWFRNPNQEEFVLARKIKHNFVSPERTGNEYIEKKENGGFNKIQSLAAEQLNKVSQEDRDKVFQQHMEDHNDEYSARQYAMFQFVQGLLDEQSIKPDPKETSYLFSCKFLHSMKGYFSEVERS